MSKLYQFQTANHIISGKDAIQQTGEHLKILDIKIKKL